MRDISNLVQKVNFTRKSADDFDDALLSIKKAFYRKNLNEPKLNTPRKVILNYLTLLLETKRNNYSKSRKIPALYILKNLQDFYNIEDEELESSLQDLRMTIQESLEGLTEEDFKLLENIAESFDTECITMFQRMQGK
jgi:hypothetical protein